MPRNGHISPKNIPDAADKEKEAEKLQKDLQAARRQVVVENYNARQSRKHTRDGGASRTSREAVSAVQKEVKDLEKKLETVTGVNDYDRIGLTASGAAAGMGASYVGAGSTMLKGTDMLVRSGTDDDIVKKRGEVVIQQYDARQNTKRSRTGSSNDRSARESARQLGRELQEITAAKEAEALEKQLGLMKAASALEDEYERLARKSASDISHAKLGASDVGKFLIDTGVAGTQLAADAAANALVPGAGIALQGVRSFGDASQEARRAGASVGQQVAYGGLTAGKDAIIEKIFDGVGGAYGKGTFDKYMKTPPIKEGMEEFASTAVQPIIRSIYSGETDYDQSVFKDALRNAAIAGVASGAISAWDDARNWALDKTYDMAVSPQTQAKLRKSYAGTPVQSSKESYRALLRMLYNRKGDGHRW